MASGQPTEWTQQRGGALPSKLLRMPGAILSITSSPAAPTSLFLASSEACCHLDMAQPLDGSGSGDAGGGDSARHKRRRSAHKPVLASEPPGANCRMIYCADPVLYAAYLGPEALLVVSARRWVAAVLVEAVRMCWGPQGCLLCSRFLHAPQGLPAPFPPPPWHQLCRWSGRGQRCTRRLQRLCGGTAMEPECGGGRAGTSAVCKCCFVFSPCPHSCTGPMLAALQAFIHRHSPQANMDCSSA